MTTLIPRSIITAGLLGVAGIANAQSAGDLAAYSALANTPTGALAPLITPLLGGGTRTISLAPQFSHTDGGSTYALTAIFPSSTTASGFALTGGWRAPDCNNCDGYVTVGGALHTPVSSSGLGNTADAGRLLIGVDADVGFAKPSNTTLISGSASLPIALVVSSSGARIAPFISPGIGFGYRSVDTGLTSGSDSGLRMTLGGGVGIKNATGTLGLDVGAKRVFIDHGDTVFGLGLVFTP